MFDQRKSRPYWFFTKTEEVTLLCFSAYAFRSSPLFPVSSSPHKSVDNHPSFLL